MTRHLSTLLLLISCFLGTNCQQKAYPVSPTSADVFPRFVPSKKPPFTPPKDQAFTFGYLEVRETRDNPNSNIIRLPVYRMKSRNANPAPDPVIFLSGGPGTSAMYNAPYMNYWQYLEERDVILFEQRGTLYAEPHLSCPEWGQAQQQALALAYSPDPTDGDKIDSLYQSASQACKDRLIQQQTNLDAYHTEAIAADVEALCEVWDIDQCNLLTISYGTKIAQVLARDYPDRIRSIVMSGALPLEANWEEENLQNLYETYQRIFTDCEGDSSCSQAFPDLGSRFWEFLENITQNPLVLEVPTPSGKEVRTFYLKGRDIALMLGELNTTQVPDIPLYIHQILAGDYSKLIAGLQDMQAGSGAMMGMRISVWCAEEMPFVDRDKLATEATRYPALSGDISPVIDPAICDIWGVQARPPRENQPVNSSIPTLIISGSYDEITPVKWGTALEKNFSNSFHLIFKGFKHTPLSHWTNPCAMRASHAFFEHPDVRPEPECFEELASPSFRTR